MDNITTRLGYYDADLQIEYVNCKNVDIIETPLVIDNNYYNIFYAVSGIYEIHYHNKIIIINNGGMVITKNNCRFKTKRISRSGERLIVNFYSTINQSPNNSLFNLFFNAEPNKPFYPANFKNKTCYELLNSLVDNLIEKRNRFYMLIKMNAIIAELNFEYERKNKLETFDKSNVSLSILQYVKNNYFENITLSILKNKFFVSNSTINRVFKNATGKTFKVFLNDLRLENAQKMINSNNLNLSVKKISEMNGFSNYSTFYREYKRKYKRMPKEDLVKEHESIWPLK